MELSKEILLEIYENTVNKFKIVYEKKWDKKPTVTQTFKLQGYDDRTWTLEDSMKANPAVLAFIEKKNKGKSLGQQIILNPRYLYDKVNKLKKEKKESNKITIKAPYDELLFLYLGYKNLDDFEKELSEKIVHYKGYYYSYRKHNVFEYDLRINYDRKPNYEGVKNQEFSVEEQGYHDHKDKPTYQGYGSVIGGNLQLILWFDDDGDRLRIILESGDDPKENSAMRGSILAVSSFQGKPITSLETIIVRQDGLDEKNDLLRVRRYLLLHRNNFRINPLPINLKVLKVQGVGVDLIRNFVGAWKAFRYDKEKKSIISSIIYVRDDYHITCYNNHYGQDNLREQVCLPNITTYVELNTRTICLECYPKEGAKVISTIMLKMPDGNEITGGTITFVGENNGYPSMRAIVIGKDEKLYKRITNSETPKLIIKEEIEKLKTLEEAIELESKQSNDLCFYQKIYDLLIELEDR